MHSFVQLNEANVALNGVLLERPTFYEDICALNRVGITCYGLQVEMVRRTLCMNPFINNRTNNEHNVLKNAT